MNHPCVLAVAPLTLVVSAPSGAGKSTLIRHLLSQRADCALSISHTTRRPRAGEVDGVDYHFVDDAGFDAIDADIGFLEQAEVHGHRYGTSRGELLRLHAANLHAILDVDVQGFQQLNSVLPELVSVFVLPPTLEELERRLRGRQTDSTDVVARRLARAAAEMGHALDYDYIVVNDELSASSSALLAIVQAELCRAKRSHAAVRRAGLQPAN